MNEAAARTVRGFFPPVGSGGAADEGVEESMVKKRMLSVAALWLALIALVLVYTDRDAYRWRYEGEDVALIVCSRQEAEAAQAEAAQAMQAER